MTAYRQCVLLIVVAVAANDVLAQPELEPVSTDAAAQLADLIGEIEARAGPNSAELVEPLTGLALIYHENGAPELALANVERARGIVSINYGLYSLEEVPLLRQAIRSQEARGDSATAWDLEQELLALVGRHPHDPRTVPVYLEIGGKRVDVLERYIRGEFPPQIILGCYYAGLAPVQTPEARANCHAGSKGVAIGAQRREAGYFYRTAINTLLRNEATGDELRALLAEIAPGAYRTGVRVNVAAVFRRLLEYEAANPVPPLRRAETLIQVADWNLLSLHRSDEPAPGRVPGSIERPRRGERPGTDYETVLEQYGRAYAELEGAGIGRETIDEFFSPSTPAVLPAFLPNPLASQQTPRSSGYIDVTFAITKYGYAENIEILDTTENVLRRAENDLVDLIEGSVFRPRMSEGEFAAASPVVVRYFVTPTPY